MEERNQEKALENHLILGIILSNLNYLDLLSCRNVNKFWATIAETFSHKFRLYKITLGDDFYVKAHEPEPEMPIRVEEICGFGHFNCRIIQIFWPLNLQELLEILRQGTKNHEISIQLEITSTKCKYSYYLPFLEEFGEDVHVFCWRNIVVYMSSFLRLTKHFMNLRVLKGDRVKMKNDCWNPNEAPIFLGVRKIYLDMEVREKEMGEISRILMGLFPKVEEIWDVPLGFLGGIREFGKIGAVRSLSSQLRNYLRTSEKIRKFTECLGLLADDGVALREIEIPGVDGKFGSRNLPEKINPAKEIATMYQSIFKPGQDLRGALKDMKEDLQALFNPGVKLRNEFHRVLKSSQNTLELIKIAPSEFPLAFFPLTFPVPATTTLCLKNDFENKNFNEPEESKPYEYFPPGIDLQRMLPNLEEIQINSSCECKSAVADCFPATIFEPLKSQVKVLKLQFTTVEVIQEIPKYFPALEFLELKTSTDQFFSVLQTILTEFSSVISLTINLNLFDDPKYFLALVTSSIEPQAFNISSEHVRKLAKLKILLSINKIENDATLFEVLENTLQPFADDVYVGFECLTPELHIF